MANYFDFMKDLKNPFAGMGKSITDPLAKGGLSILGSEVPEEYAAYENAGLLGPGVYDKSIAAAKTRGNRNAVIQGLLKFGTQNFNKGVGSIFNPAYLGDPLITAMNASQKQFDKLAPNAMNLEKLKTFKATKDKEVNRLAMVAKIKSNPNLTEAEREMVDFMSMPELIAASKPKIHKAPTKGEREYNENGVQMVQDQLWNSTDKAFVDRETPPRRKWQQKAAPVPKNPQFQNLVNEAGLTQRWQVVGDNLKDTNNDNVPDEWIPRGEPYKSREQKDNIKSAGKSLQMASLGIVSSELGFKPLDSKLMLAASYDLAQAAQQIKVEAASNDEFISDAESLNRAKEQMITSGAYTENSTFGPDEAYDRNKFLTSMTPIQKRLTPETNSQSTTKPHGIMRNGVIIPIEIKGTGYVFSDTKEPVPTQ